MVEITIKITDELLDFVISNTKGKENIGETILCLLAILRENENLKWETHLQNMTKQFPEVFRKLAQ